MAEYGQRERRFNKSLPGHFANYTKGLVTADAEGKMQYLAFVKAILAEENVTIEQKISILTLKQPLSIGLSLPVAGVVDMSPVGIEEATLKMSMTVHASDVAETSKDASGSGEGKATFGWGLVKGSVSMKVSTSTHSSRKRSSDYTSTTDAVLTIKRQPVPETLAKVLDTYSEVAKDAMAINQQIIARQVEAADEESEEVTDAIPAEDESSV